ncbi:MAG TPA: hypothetical protein PKI62_16900 [bacterium]|nr:hypothetical protein [bacterium]HPR89342.1 hypothetical protein [bacterium]
MLKRFGLVLGAATLIALGCSGDHGLAPQPGRLVVDVFFTGTPPPTTQGIYLIVAPKFPPHAINELYHIPNSLPIDRDSVHAVIDLPYGHYDAISLWWYSNETKSNLADVLSLPLDIDNGLIPLGFDLTRENPEAFMELHPDWGRVNRDAYLEGTITFNGPFPKNTLATAVAAYSFIPTANVEYLTWLKSIDFSVGTNPYHYKLPIRSGTVSYLVVLWLPERSALTGFTELGFLEDPAKPGTPLKLKIKAGETRQGLDLYADWSKATTAFTARAQRGGTE